MRQTKIPHIIELYGLPGCGKTTLRDNLVAPSNESTSYALMTELSQKFRSLSIANKIRYIPIKIWWSILLFFFSMPRLNIKDWIFYKVFFSFALVYNFSKYTTGSDYIVIDHGFIQGVVSLMNGKVVRLNKKQKTRLISVIEKLPVCTFVYCEIPAEVSLGRIRSRQRDHGRLDVLKDNNTLCEKLKEEELIFNDITSWLNDVKNIKSLCLDSTGSQSECLTHFKQMIEHEK